MNRNAATLVIVGMLALVGTSASAEGVQADNSAKNVRAEGVPADNSAKNVRDRADTALTPGDQSSAPADVAITTEVRKAVVADSNLSINAQNVKIITVAGVVTLRGPVKNAAEKESVAVKAKQVAGVSKVDNQLEIASE